MPFLLDGGTLFHINCLAVGTLIRNASGLTFHVLYVLLFGKVTVTAIHEVSCVCHIIQLVLNGISDEDSYFWELAQIMKFVLTRISLLKKAQIDS